MPLVHPRLADGQAHREQGAVAAPALHHARLAHHACHPRGQVLGHVTIVLLLLLVAHQHLDALTDQSGHGVTEHRAGRSIALHDAPLRIGHHDGLGHRLKNAVELALAQAQVALHGRTLVDLLAQLLDRGFAFARQGLGIQQGAAQTAHREPNHQKSREQQTQQNVKGPVEHGRAGELPLRHRQDDLQGAAHVAHLPIHFGRAGVAVVASHAGGQHAVGLRIAQHPLAVERILTHKRLIGVGAQMGQGRLLKFIQLALTHAPRKGLIAVEPHLGAAIDLGQVVPELNRQGRRQRQCGCPVAKIVGDVHATLHRTGHQLLGIKVAKLGDGVCVGLRAVCSVLAHHALAGLVGVKNHPSPHEQEEHTQNLQGPLHQALAHVATKTTENNHVDPPWTGES